MFVPRRLVQAYKQTSAAGDRFRRAMRRELRLTPRNAQIPFEALTLRTEDGLSISGWHVPATSVAPRAERLGVVLHPHYGGQKAMLLSWLRLFHDLGLDALALDGRGHGASAPRPPGLECFVRRAADVHAAADELRRRGVGRLLGFGQSQGAAVVLIAASSRPDMEGLILDSGPPPTMGLGTWGLAGAMLELGRVNWGLPERVIAASRLLVRTRPLRYTTALWSSLWRLRDRPLLWIHGGEDRVIAPAWASLWYEAMRPRHSDLPWQALRVDQADHLQTLQTNAELVQAAVVELVARVTATRS